MNINVDASSASAEVSIIQRIEAEDVKDLVKNGKLSLSFLMRNNNFTTVALKVYHANTTDNFSAQTLIHTAPDQVFTADTTAKEVKFENIDAPTSILTGLAIEIIYKGFTLSTADDTATTKIMLNAGKIAFSFNRAGDNVGEEGSLCQRYYEKGGGLAAGVFTRGTFVDVNASIINGDGFATSHYVTEKRAIPSIIVYDGLTQSVDRASSLSTTFGVNSGALFINETTHLSVFNISGGTLDMRASTGRTTVKMYFEADAEL
jgi:hypothetical protein